MAAPHQATAVREERTPLRRSCLDAMRCHGVGSLHRSTVKLSMPKILKGLTAKNTYKSLISRMENTGFEPVTSALQGRRSPI
jgi:hypothetical protein